MPSLDVAQLVAADLEELSSESGPIRTDGPRSTVESLSARELTIRTVEVAQEYLARQTGVSADGRAAVVTAGPPGAGKSTALAGTGFSGNGFRDIDPDVVKELLIQRALKDGSFNDLLTIKLADGKPVRPMELSSLVHRESVKIADAVLAVCVAQGENVIVHGSLAWDGQPKTLVEGFEAANYEELMIIDVEVPLVSALQQSLNRWWIGRNNPADQLGGRFVPRRFIESLYRPNGETRCKTNAEVLLAISRIPKTSLRLNSRAGGITTQTIQTRDGLEGDAKGDDSRLLL